jgi:hypothetical protein
MRTLVCALLLIRCGFGQTARDIVVRSVHEFHENAKLTSRYTYREKTVVHEYDSSGKVKKTDRTTEELLFLGGKPYEHLIEKDGKPLTGDAAAKEQRKFDKAAAEASHLTDEQKQKRLDDYARDQQKDLDRMQAIPDAFDFRQLADEAVGPRLCYVIEATPKPSFHGKYANLYHNVKGRIWIDKTDYEWVRVQADVLNDISWGLFLAKVSKGAEMKFEQVRVNDEIWLPKQILVQAHARALLKHVSFDLDVEYSDYRRYQTDSRIVSTETN